MVKCPHCNVELKLDETYDREIMSWGVILYHAGHCPECEREYQWDESAELKQWDISNLRLV